MDAKTTWATTALAAVVGLVGALGGAYLGAGAALQAAEQQSEAARLDRLASERTEMNLQVLDASAGLWWAWSMYKSDYPRNVPEQDYWTTYVLPRANELQKSLTLFDQATARSRAYASTPAREAVEALAVCSQDLLSATEGPNNSLLPPSDEQWGESSTCFTDATAALELVIQDETLPEQTEIETAGCGFFRCGFR